MRIHDPIRAVLPVAATLACLVSSPADAQIRVLDEGTFELFVSGASAGSETFSIRRSGSDANPQIVATAEITILQPEGEIYLRPALQVVGRDLRVTAYQQKISGARVEDIFLTAENDRFYTRSRTEEGEREREFRAPAGALVLEPLVAHHYHFLANAAVVSDVMAVVVPMDGRQDSLPFSEVGPETIDVGGTSVSATRLRLGDATDGISVWVDEGGRVLRVDNPSANYSAVRTELPSPSQ